MKELDSESIAREVKVSIWCDWYCDQLVFSQLERVQEKPQQMKNSRNRAQLRRRTRAKITSNQMAPLKAHLMLKVVEEEGSAAVHYNMLMMWAE